MSSKWKWRRLDKPETHTLPVCKSTWTKISTVIGIKNETAGNEWFVSFMERHLELSLQSPEARSLGHVTSFNKGIVNAFTANLKSLYDRLKLTPDCIYDCNLTGVTRVQNLPKVIAARGEKQVD